MNYQLRRAGVKDPASFFVSCVSIARAATAILLREQPTRECASKNKRTNGKGLQELRSQVPSVGPWLLGSQILLISSESLLSTRKTFGTSNSEEMPPHSFAMSMPQIFILEKRRRKLVIVNFSFAYILFSLPSKVPSKIHYRFSLILLLESFQRGGVHALFVVS